MRTLVIISNAPETKREIWQIERSCPLCGQVNMGAPVFMQKGVWRINKCRKCGFIYLENPPTYSELAEEFAWEKSSRMESENRRKKEPVLYNISKASKKFIKKFFKRGKLTELINSYFTMGNILDIGCGAGNALAGLKPWYVPFGIEISKNLSETANLRLARRGGLVINTDAIEGLNSFQPEFFSGIIMSGYLEHEMNPMGVLKDSFRTIKPGGHLIIKVPNYGSINRILRGHLWCGFRFPDHVNYFTSNSLKEMVSKAGFNVAKFGFFDHLPTSDSLWMVVSVPDKKQYIDVDEVISKRKLDEGIFARNVASGV
ncbi:MAG: class I SAM-dependent methyltransferase [Nitrospirota bacterium]